MATEKNTKLDDALKSELRRTISSEIERLDALYDVEMAKYLDLAKRIRHAQKIGAGADDTTRALERDLAIAQKNRRTIGDQASCKRQELRDVDGLALETEFELQGSAEPKREATATKAQKKVKAVPPAAFKNFGTACRATLFPERNKVNCACRVDFYRLPSLYSNTKADL